MPACSLCVGTGEVRHMPGYQTTLCPTCKGKGETP